MPPFGSRGFNVTVGSTSRIDRPATKRACDGLKFAISRASGMWSNRFGLFFSAYPNTLPPAACVSAVSIQASINSSTNVLSAALPPGTAISGARVTIASRRGPGSGPVLELFDRDVGRETRIHVARRRHDHRCQDAVQGSRRPWGHARRFDRSIKAAVKISELLEVRPIARLVKIENHYDQAWPISSVETREVISIGSLIARSAKGLSLGSTRRRCVPYRAARSRTSSSTIRRAPPSSRNALK